MEDDLGTRLDWVAVDHFNTGHPHTHIIVRGKDDRSKDLIIARDYIMHGMRERACELLELDLGPRSDRAIEDRLRREVGQDRLTSIDRSLIRDADADGIVAAKGKNAFDQSIRIGRLQKLEKLRLAEPRGAGHWRLDPQLSETLKCVGERDDIIRTLQRAYSDARAAPPLVDQLIYSPGNDARPLIGRVVERGLSDELHDRQYCIVEATDGRSHYVDLGKTNENQLARGAIVRIEPVRTSARDVDRTVAAIAAVNDGRYSVDLHLKHDPAATQAFAETHVRRLEAIRRVTGGVSREADGTWIVAPDHVDRAADFEAARAKDRPVRVEILSVQPLEQLADANAATWIDRELVEQKHDPVRDARFGRDLRLAMERRQQWLIAEGLAEKSNGEIHHRSDMIDRLRRRELVRLADQLSRELGKPFVEARPGARIEGDLTGPVDMISGRMALVETSREFALVPWRPMLARQIGRRVSGVVREGGISWRLGRSREPTI
uniref:Conjugal transfer protein TraI n=1 Tax=Sphingobium sp. YW16 TaxID=1165377 RepID=A0A1U9YB11_9SPHN|nr:conjugal transfer protein TraI [Sphingobium sp. YW16]